MHNAPHSRESLSPEEIRERVDQVMTSWQSYPDFASFWSALLAAGGLTSDKKLASVYRNHTCQTISSQILTLYRAGGAIPPYPFIEELADQCLFLPLDAKLFRPATAAEPAGPYRTALFAAAGLLEVTPESTRDWNREVLAGYDRLRFRDSQVAILPWCQLVHKLVVFQMQGGRKTLGDLAAQARVVSHDPALFAGDRLEQLLKDKQSIPSEQERLALYQILGLDENQARHLEEAIEAGRLPWHTKHPPTPFSRQLTEIMDRLAAAGISSRQLARMTADPVTEEEAVSHTVLSTWKCGKKSPTLATLRAVTRALRRCAAQDGGRLVPDEEVGTLVRAAGFTPEELTANCHEVIGRVADQTRIQPLLWAIRNASDLSVPLSAVAERDHRPPLRAVQLPSERSIGDWEKETANAYPTASQVRELLDRYNLILEEKGRPAMTHEEIERVLVVADRDRQRWLERPQEVRVAQRRQPGRRLLRPTFEDDEGLGR